LRSPIERLTGGLIVSCQPVIGGSLDRPEFVVGFARAAEASGAAGLRIEGLANLRAVRAATALPIIGIVKRPVPASPVFITPERSDVAALAEAGADIIAFDATVRPRPESVKDLLALPFLVDFVYSVSRVTFETIRAPSFIGLGNFFTVMRDADFWRAMLFSLRFAVLTTVAEVAVGLFLVIFLAPLLSPRPWLIAILMLPMMVAPALVGLMYRLILHEFVGVVPYYFYLFTK